MNDEDLSFKLFDAFRLYSRQTFLNDFIPFKDGICFDGNLYVRFELMMAIGKTIEDPGHTYLEIKIIDPSLEDYDDVFVMLVDFDVSFDKVTNYEIDNGMEIVSVERKEAYRKLKLHFEQTSCHKIEDLYSQVQLWNVEMV